MHDNSNLPNLLKLKKSIKIFLIIGISIFAIKSGEIARRYWDKDYRKKVKTRTWNSRIATFQAESHKKDTIYQDVEFLFVGNKGATVDVVRRGELKKIKSKGDTLFSNEYVTFLGDLENEPEIFIKYNQRYKFEDFQTEVYQGKLSDPDFSTDKGARRFITRIIKGSKNRPNFAGKLSVINWGCGTNCQSGVILNSETGEIYDGITTSCNFKSKPDSRLLIAEYGYFENRENAWLPFPGSYLCLPKYYVWDWQKKHLIQLE